MLGFLHATHTPNGGDDPPAAGPSTLLCWLARVCRTAREDVAGYPQRTIADEAGVDHSTISRFEHAKAWPSDPGNVVRAYAHVLELDELKLWTTAIRMWRRHRQDNADG